MTLRRKSASNCPGKCRYPTSVHPGFIAEMACLDAKTGVSRQKLTNHPRLQTTPLQAMELVEGLIALTAVHFGEDLDSPNEHL